MLNTDPYPPALVSCEPLAIQVIAVEATETRTNSLLFTTAALANTGAPGSGPGALDSGTWGFWAVGFVGRAGTCFEGGGFGTGLGSACCA